MHEIRATVRPSQIEEIAALARSVGIGRIAVSDIHILGDTEVRKLISVETSTKARAFVDAILASPSFRDEEHVLTSRELRAIVDNNDLAELTRPMSELSQTWYKIFGS